MPAEKLLTDREITSALKLEASTQTETEEVEPTFKVLDCRGGKRIERSLPLSLGIKDWTGEIKPFKISERELEELGARHDCYTNQNIGDFGEKLVDPILTKFYGLKEVSPKLRVFVRDKGDRSLDRLKQDEYGNLWLIEVKTTFGKRTVMSSWKDIVDSLDKRGKSLLSEIPALRGRVRKLIVNLDFREKRAIYRPLYSKLLDKGVNFMEVRPLSSYNYPAKYKQIFQCEVEGVPRDKIAEKFHIKKNSISGYIYKAKHPDRYKEGYKKYNKAHKSQRSS